MGSREWARAAAASGWQGILVAVDRAAGRGELEAGQLRVAVEP